MRLPFAGTLLPVDVVNLPDTAKLGAAPQYKYKYRHLQYTLYLYAQHQYIVILHNEMHQLNEQYDDVLAMLLSKHPQLHVLLVGTSWWNGRRENALGYGRLVGRIRRSIDRLMDDEEDRPQGKNEPNEPNEPNEGATETTTSSYGSSSTSSVPPQSQRVLMKQRVRHITGLSRPNYLSLLAAVNVVLDPVTEDGSGTENGLLMALETMMIGTPIVTLRPKEEERGWAGVQPTSVVASLIEAVGGGSLAKHCVATDVQDYIAKVSLLIGNATLQHSIRKTAREKTKPWVQMQNKQVEHAWLNFLERVGRPYANSRTVQQYSTK